MEMRGSCIAKDNGEYLRDEFCRSGYASWKSLDGTRRIRWDPISSIMARYCAQGGRWVLVRTNNEHGTMETCAVEARQESFGQVRCFYRDTTTWFLQEFLPRGVYNHLIKMGNMIRRLCVARDHSYYLSVLNA